MYFSTDTMTYAIDAATCGEKWKRSRHVATPGGGPAVNRGVAYADGRVFRGTSDTHVLALDAGDGHTVWDVQLDVAGPGVQLPMAPVVWKGLVFIGNAGGDRSGVIGHVYALDAATGQVKWKFDVVPASGPARETWGRGAAAAYPISGGAFWTSFTLDETAGVLFVSSGNPAPDFDSAMRTARTSMPTLSSRSMRRRADARVQPARQQLSRLGRRQSVAGGDDSIGARRRRLGQQEGCCPSWTAAESRRARRSTLAGTPSGSRFSSGGDDDPRKRDAPLSRDRATRFCPESLAAPNGTARRTTRRETRSSSGERRCSTCSFNVRIPRCRGSAPCSAIPREASAWIRRRRPGAGSPRSTPRTATCDGNSRRRSRCWPASRRRRWSRFHRGSRRQRVRVRCRRRARPLADFAGLSIGGGVVSYVAGGHQRIGVASGMRSPIWPGGAQSSHIVVYGVSR